MSDHSDPRYQDRRERAAAMRALVRRLDREYADDPNVVGVGWGLARRGGRLRPEVSVVFYVRRKLQSERLLEAFGTTPIPREIEGVPTDVVVDGRDVRLDMAGARDDTSYDPLLGGVSSANLEHLDRTFFWAELSRGTLGILCRDAEGRAMALSNWHVWADVGAEIGDRIVQPSTPAASEYAQGVTKVAACGPLFSTVVEGRVPSPLAGGLYGGAAAAGVLAGMSDHRDPFRRGEEATEPPSGAFTHEEAVDVRFDYNESPPWPGRPFVTDVTWRYLRRTNQGEQTVSVQERRINRQVLLGQALAPTRAGYRAGGQLGLRAAVWDYQLRPADTYHVVAHLIPDADRDRALRLALHPAPCTRFDLAPRYVDDAQQEANPVQPLDGGGACIRFGHFPSGRTFPYEHSFGPVAAFNHDDDFRIVDWVDGELPGMQVPEAGMSTQHAPADRLTLTVAQFTGDPVRVTALNNLGQVVDTAQAPPDQGVVHTLTLAGALISRARIEGGGGEGVVLEYCVQPATEDATGAMVPPWLRDALLSDGEVGSQESEEPVRLRVFRHCFMGTRPLPFDLPTGRWRAYLTVSGINDVPDGTPPIEAAPIIGGQELGASSQALLCGFMLLGDHVFDIF